MPRMLPEQFTTDRQYLHVQPSTDPFQPTDIARSITRLHRTTNETPTYEWLFVATGDTGPTGDRHIDWYVGSDNLQPVKRTLRQSLPSSVDLVETTTSYRDALDVDGPPESDTDNDAADYTVAGVEWQGVGDRPDDWQTPLPALESFGGEREGDWPLAALLDGLATTDAPALVQIMVTPKPDWTATKEDRIVDLELNGDLRRHELGQAIFGSIGDAITDATDHDTTRSPSYRRHDSEPGQNASRRETDTPAGRQAHRRVDDTTIAPSNARRIEAIHTVDARQSFVVNARAVAVATDSATTATTINAITSGFQAIRGDHYRVTPTTYPPASDDARALLEDVCTRTTKTSPTSRKHVLPWVENASPAIVADPAAVGSFCVVDGASLGPAASRALEPTPEDRTGIELPPRTILDRYLDQPGMTVGHPKTGDRTTLDAMFALPPTVQPLHTAIFGSTGAGKTAVGQRMQLSNHAATDGATIYIDAKGDVAPEQYAKTHYARYDTLEDVYYFDCTEYLPALPFLTIEPLLEAGLDREWAVNTVAEHYVDLLAAAMGREQFYSAEAAVEVIQQLVRALFDPVHGADSISQQELLAAATQFHETKNPPPVSDGTLHQKLASTAANNPTTFDSIMSAATRRIGTATNDARLAPLFEAQADEQFDLRETLDEDCVIVFDLQGYGERSRTLLAVAILSQLWRALQRRQTTTQEQDLPLVNCYIEEAADLATTGILDTLLAQGRGFDLAVTLAMQFPEQLRDSHPRVYAELLNDVGTIITGQIGVDQRLTERLATSEYSADRIETRLHDIQRGEWLVSPAAPFAERQPRPFHVASPPLPPGHPESDAPLAGSASRAFKRTFETAKTRTRDEYGVAVGRAASGSTEPASVDAGDATGSTLPAATATIPHTERFPDCLTYIDEPPYPLVCETCETDDTRYASTPEGMRRAIDCHHSLDDVDRANIPICSLDLTLTGGERAASDYTDAQLRFLTAVYMAHQQRFDPALEYDIVWDSMTNLEAYVGIDTDDVQELVDDGVLRVDCRRPHKLYTVTPEGRDVIDVGHREGIAHGDGTGDLSESSLHVAMVEVGARLLDQEFVGPDHPGERVQRYYGVEDGRLDAAVLDADGDVVVTLEAERINNDRGEAIPRDFDQMAACDPQQALWLVKTRSDAASLLQALHDPPTGESRVPRTYSENMAPRKYSLDTPGLTDVYTFEYARDTLLDDSSPE
ncbi:type IV secretory system conjugative DNA transfer family protein [Halobacterium hubeiense]|uniref:type IV secretory system conjugative DNA transfer family protein n=1 Tax=Halobacterium hubeiense TaxID=1407499 RepID=UPI003C76AD5E